MISCPVKSSKEWKTLSSALGEDRAMFAYVRNKGVIPDVARGRELITNKGLLESLDDFPKISEESIIDTLKQKGIIQGEPIKEDGKLYYQINQNRDNIGRMLGDFTDQYGTVLDYKGDKLTINKTGINAWNNVGTLLNLKNSSLTELCKSFLDKVGVKVEEQDDVIKRYGSNGIADIADRMVKIQSGKMDVALPEEALHFFLEMLPQDNVDLVNALNEIVKTKIYKETLAEYKDKPNYRVNGVINFSKIKKEALAKDIAAKMKADEKNGYIDRIINAILEWVNKHIIKKDSATILKELFYSKEIALLNTNIDSKEIYNQLTKESQAFYEAQTMNESQKETLNKVIAFAHDTAFDPESHAYMNLNGGYTGDKLRSTTKIIGSEFYGKLENVRGIALAAYQGSEYIRDIVGNVIEQNASDKEKGDAIIVSLMNSIIDKSLTKEDLLTIFDNKVSVVDIVMTGSEMRQKTLFGSAIHSIVESLILGKDFDLDEILQTKKIENIALSNLIDRKTLDKIVNGNAYEKGLKDIIRDIRADGSIIMTEVSVSNIMVAGTLDIIAIDKNGVAHVYDFKTKYAKNYDEKGYVKKELVDEFNTQIRIKSRLGVKDEPDTLEDLKGKTRSNLEKYSQQLSIYKKLLMEAGIKVGTLNVIGVPYRLNADSNKVTEIKPVLVSNIPFLPNIAEYHFLNMDESFDATAKQPVVLKEKEGIETVKKIEKQKLQEAFAKALGRLTEITKRFTQTGNKDELFKLLNNEISKTNKLEDQKTNIRAALETMKDVDINNMVNFINIQNNFLEIIESSKPIITTAIEYFNKLKNDIPTNEEGASQRLSELMKTKEFLMGYQNMFKEFLGYMKEDATSESYIVKELTDLNGKIDNIHDVYIDTITPVISQMMGSVFDEDSLNNINREYSELIAAATIRGDKKREAQLRQERDNLPSQKVINELLKGDKGDANFLFSRLMATVSNPDIILAGVAKKIKARLDIVRLENKKFRDSLDLEFVKRAKVYGRGLDIKKINESLTTIVSEINASSGDSMNVLHFKTEFNENLYSEYNKRRYDLNKAIEDKKPKDVIEGLKQEIRDFERRYFETGYTDEYYKLTSPLDEVVTYQNKSMTIRSIDKQLRDQKRNLDAEHSTEDKLYGKIDEKYNVELRAINDVMAALRDKTDEFGNIKTGDALKIAEVLSKYDEDFKKLFEFVEQTEYYNKAREKAKLDYGEESDEFKKWESENTRVVIKDEFYKERAELLEEKAALLNDVQPVELSELYKELQTLTKQFKDKDGNIKGTFIKEELIDKIKNIESKIEQVRLSSTVNLKNGLTGEELARRDSLYYALNNGMEINLLELSELKATGENRLDAFRAADPNFDTKRARVKEIDTLLLKMNKSEPTKYYYEELEKQKINFADSQGIKVNELGKKNTDGVTYYSLFKKSDWYTQNHVIKITTLYEDESESGIDREVMTEKPAYHWRRNMPSDSKYIEMKPGSHFNKIVEKDFYLNDQGEKVILKVEDDLDILGRFKPKSNEKYKKEYKVDHPYLDQEYKQLKDRYNNKTASEKERVDYENLLYIHDQLQKAQENIPMNDRLGFAVPFLEKHTFERTIETTGGNIIDKGKSIVNGVKRAVSRTDQDADVNGINTKEEALSMNNAKLATMDNNQAKFVPVRFTKKGDVKEASYNVWGSVLDYVSSITRRNELQKELSFINGLEEILGEPENQPKSESNNLILNNIFKKYIPDANLNFKINKGSNIRLDTLKSYINTVLYNEDYFQGADMFGINTQKAISVVSGLSSYALLGAAPLSAAVNFIGGNVQNIIESVGGKNYSFKDFMSAHRDIYTGGKYGCAIKDMKDDYLNARVGNLSFFGQINEIFDPFQGEFENEYGEKTNFNHAKNIFKLGLFGGKIWGEWEIQMKSFLAFIKSYKVYDGDVISREDFITKKIGVNVDDLSMPELTARRLEAIKEWDKLTVNMLDLFEKNDKGIVVVKDEYKNVLQLGSPKFSNIIGKLHAMQKKLNGSYAKIDKSYVEKTSIGRMIFFFKKYFIPIGMNRWGTRRTDYESMTSEQGFYLTFLQTVGKDLTKFKFNIVKNWHTYSPAEKIAIKKTLVDVGILLAVIASYSILFGFDPDDKDRYKKLREKGWAAQAAVFILLKVRSESRQFMPPFAIQELQNIYQNPSLIFSQVTGYIKTTQLLGIHALNMFPGNWESSLYYQKDVDESGLKDKGDSKFIAALSKLAGYSGKTFEPIDAIKGFTSTLNK